MPKKSTFFGNSPEDPDSRTPGHREQALRLIRLGAVVSVSAVCGGIAAVLLNRSVLKRLREAASAPPPEPAQGWTDEEEVPTYSGHG